MFKKVGDSESKYSMLVLFDTAAGYAFFKLSDDHKLEKIHKVWKELESPDSTSKSLELVSFKSFKTVNEALNAVNGISEGNISKSLQKSLKKQLSDADTIAVGDTRLSSLIKNKFLNVQCLTGSSVEELMRGIREHADCLLAEHNSEIKQMRLALAHSLARYKVKFNPEKIDTMIVQAVSLLDDLDKELNNYAMRLREWYGWHFPELGRIVQDHVAYAKVVKAVGMKQNAQDVDLDSILPEELVQQVKQEAEMSMGTDITEFDLIHVGELCDQVIDLTKYRSQLFDYLKNRMHALAPNLTVLLGELVGARLISRAGSLVGLAKLPSSTVQLLGAEKALFRALKTKKDTPKYGIIYHAQLVSQSTTKLKGKIARKLAAKVSISTRVDALCDESLGNETGIKLRAYLEGVIKTEQERPPKKFSGAKKAPGDFYSNKKKVFEYDSKSDFNLKGDGSKKRFAADDGDEKPKKKPKTEHKEEENKK